MKQEDKQILAMLQAYNQTAVLKAFDLYVEGIENENEKMKAELKKEGWSSQKNKPENREFYKFGKDYWVQSDEMREKQIKEQIDLMRKRRKPVSKQAMGLNKTAIKCPICAGKMYKQSVCGGCKEGKNGYKIRLICEENPDHEILL